jgi:hypothetical protein
MECVLRNLQQSANANDQPSKNAGPSKPYNTGSHSLHHFVMLCSLANDTSGAAQSHGMKEEAFRGQIQR